MLSMWPLPVEEGTRGGCRWDTGMRRRPADGETVLLLAMCLSNVKRPVCRTDWCMHFFPRSVSWRRREQVPRGITATGAERGRARRTRAENCRNRSREKQQQQTGWQANRVAPRRGKCKADLLPGCACAFLVSGGGGGEWAKRPSPASQPGQPTQCALVVRDLELKTSHCNTPNTPNNPRATPAIIALPRRCTTRCLHR